MSKVTTFTGQPILNQLLFFISKREVREIARVHCAERYVKRLDTYTHLVVMLFCVISGYHSLRELVLGLLSNAHRLSHIGLRYMVRRSTLSEANMRRSSAIFGDIYTSVLREYAAGLADSRLSALDMKRLYAMDSTTISLFKEILKGCGRYSTDGKRKGGIKAHTVINLETQIPYFVRYTEAARHDHILLREVRLPQGSCIVFDRGYVDYAQYEQFSSEGVYYVTRLKDNARYRTIQEYELADEADSRVIKDEEIELTYGTNNTLKHHCRRITYWDKDNNRMFVFLTNRFDIQAEHVALIYKKRWKIELLFKQLKQNFPLNYFLGDNVNAIEIQIWMVMLANLLLTLVRNRVRRKWAFSNMVSVVRQQLMNYVNLYALLEDPERCWMEIVKGHTVSNEPVLFPDWEKGAYF